MTLAGDDGDADDENPEQKFHTDLRLVSVSINQFLVSFGLRSHRQHRRRIAALGRHASKLVAWNPPRRVKRNNGSGTTIGEIGRP